MVRSFRSILSTLVFCCLFSVSVFAQTGLLKQLLDLPAPPPAAEESEGGEKSIRPVRIEVSENPPPDDAPLEELIQYWTVENLSANRDSPPKTPSEKTIARLLAKAREHPERLPSFFSVLSADEKTAAVVKEIYDASQNVLEENKHQAIRDWLKYKTAYFADELRAEAENARDHKTYQTVNRQKELQALAKVDWEKAAPLLERLKEDSSSPRTALFAKRLIFERAVREKDSRTIENFRAEFRKIVEDKTASGYARDDALSALLREKDAPEHDEWYLSLFADETLLLLKLGESTVTHPLDRIAVQNPDRWIPLVAKLVGNKNRAVHNAAVQALVQFQLRDARKDALEPLLPWLSNPDWANTNGDERLRLIQSVNEVDLPESVSGLLWILENDDESYNRSYAADSLQSYKDARIAPAMKAALAKEPQEKYRRRIVHALIANKSLPGEEQMFYLESYIETVATAEGFKLVEERSEFEEKNPLPVAVSIGIYLAGLTEPDEELMRRAIERHKILQREKPEIAKILSDIMTKWSGRPIDLEMLDRIADGKADADVIVGALARRKQLRERVSNELYALRGKRGAAGAFAACLLEDENDITSAFRSPEIETQIAALACARLLRVKLPVAEIGALIDSPNKLLALAAERYLEANDSPEARRLVWAKHPHEALILGARDSFNPAGQSVSGDTPINRLLAGFGTYLSGDDYEEIDKFEEKLRKELAENKDLTAIYADLPNHNKFQKVVRIYKDKATFTIYDDPARYRERKLNEKEVEFLRGKLAVSEFENSPPVYSECHHNCAMSEFVRLERAGGRRLFSITGYDVPEPRKSISEVFETLSKGDFKVAYHLANKIKGLEIVYDDEDFRIVSMWKNGDDFRMLVVDVRKKTQIEEEMQRLDQADEENEELDYQTRTKNAHQRRVGRAYESYEWREFKNGRLGNRAEEPLEIPFLRDGLTFPHVEGLDNNDNSRQSQSGNYEIRAGDFSKRGLWKTNRAELIELKKGLYANPFAAGNWAVAAKAEESWGAPNDVVRIDLRSGKEYKINLPPAEEFYPIAFLPAHNKFLLYRAKEAYSTLNPSPAEYYLLDAATGAAEPVKGEFQPLMTQKFRPLQPTGKPHEFWATVYSRARNETDFGVYDAREFKFKPLLKLPEILFSPTEMWFDAQESKIYVVYVDDSMESAHLLKIPFEPPK